VSGLAANRSSGPAPKTRWWLVFSIIALISAFLAILIEGAVAVLVLLSVGSLFLS
jgi:hypothetical protein